MLEVLTERGAVLRGHFLLTSGAHSDTYVEKARMFEDPALVAAFAREIASWYERVEAVVSPAVGALPLGFAVASEAGARFLFAEREAGRLVLRRGFALRTRERTLVVEDVVTTGGSAREVWDLVRAAGADALGVAAMVDRSEGELAVPLRALARLHATAFDPAACPLCAEGLPLDDRGSRRLHGPSDSFAS